MDRTPPSFDSVYRALSTQYKGRCPPGKSLDECELRANSEDAKSLRVKTGESSFFGRAKVRTAHQSNATRIVNNLLTSAGNDSREDPQTFLAKKTEAASYIARKRTPLTLGDLKRLQDHLNFRFLDSPPPRPVQADVSPDRDSKRSGVSASTELTAASFRTPPDPRGAASAAASSSRSPEDGPLHHVTLDRPNPGMFAASSLSLPPKKKQ